MFTLHITPHHWKHAQNLLGYFYLLNWLRRKLCKECSEGKFFSSLWITTSDFLFCVFSFESLIVYSNHWYTISTVSCRIILESCAKLVQYSGSASRNVAEMVSSRSLGYCRLGHEDRRAEYIAAHATTSRTDGDILENNKGNSEKNSKYNYSNSSLQKRVFSFLK